MSLNFNVLTSIRSDQILRQEAGCDHSTTPTKRDERHYYLLDLHRDRLVQACKAFGRESKSLQGEAGLATLERQFQVELTKLAQGNKNSKAVKVKGGTM